MSNYLELIQDVCIQTNFPVPETWDQVSDYHHQKMKRDINNILKGVCASNITQWKFLERVWEYTTTDDLWEIDFPSYMSKVRHIELYYGGRWMPVSFRKDPRFITYRETNGRPCYYSIDMDTILLRPRPDDAYNMKIHYYTKNYAQDADGVDKRKLESETDVPVIPEEYRDVIVFGASRDYIGRVDDSQYHHFASMFDNRLQSLRNHWRRTEEDFKHYTMDRKGSGRDFQREIKHFFNRLK